MRILYDYQVFTFHKYGGIACYFCEIISRLQKTESVFLGFKLSRNFFVPEKLQKSCDFEQKIEHVLEKQCSRNRKIFESIWLRIVWAWNSLVYVLLLIQHHYDVVHITYDLNIWPASLLFKTPFVYTVHDLIPELFNSSSRGYIEKRKWLARHASRVIAVSENTKADIIRLWGIDASKIDVVYHGPSVVDTGVSKWQKYMPYILFVGGRGGYKNFRWFAKSISGFLKNDGRLKLICTGASFSAVELHELSALGIKKQCLAFFVDSQEMFDLYRDARCFVYPSKYEGFGIPILDAFKAGCPVVLSRASCFPEVAQDAAVYFNLESEDGCCRAVSNFVYCEALRQEYINRGVRRVQQFSWDRAANQTLAAYRKAIAVI